MKNNSLKRSLKGIILILVLLIFQGNVNAANSEKKQIKSVLEAEWFRHYVDYFNRMEDENIAQAIPNAKAWEWIKENIPLFECPQDNFEEMYYFRWWTYRKHIKETPLGYGITEFLVERSYADKYNLISCALGHHVMEGRWLHNPIYIQDDVHIWYRGNDGGRMNKFLKFSSWTAFALYNSYLVNADKNYLTDLLPDLKSEFEQWELEKKLPSGLFWQFDVRDGMEEQISGGRKVQNARPTINSYMFGNAWALAQIAELINDQELSSYFSAKAEMLKQLTNEKLWDTDDQFFETLKPDNTFAKVREEIGFIPWYFNLPDQHKSVAWKQVDDTDGFLAPFGLTTAEQRHPDFRSHGCCNCEWDGAIWPFATAQTLTGMANLLNNYEQNFISDSTYFKHMELYVESQYHRGRPYVGEYQDETTGYWLKGDQERSRYYNHSTFNDLIITGLIGLRPRADEIVEVNPLIPEGKWDWFCLDKIAYHGKMLTIIWDKTGTKYHLGKGLIVFADGKVIGKVDHLSKLKCNL